MITIDVKDVGAQSLLDRIVGEIQGDLMSEPTAYAERQVRNYFAQGAGPDGPFAGLAASTLSQKRSGAILRETGALVGSVASSASGLTGRVTQSAAYAIYHDTGTSKMPARRTMDLKPEHIEEISEMIQQKLGSIG